MPTSDAERKLCLFRQAEALDSTLGEHESLPEDSDLARAIERPEEFACKVGGCALRGQNILDYVFAHGRAAPREAIDKVVAPSCLVLDFVHQADVDLAHIWSGISEAELADEFGPAPAEPPDQNEPPESPAG